MTRDPKHVHQEPHLRTMNNQGSGSNIKMQAPSTTSLHEHQRLSIRVKRNLVTCCTTSSKKLVLTPFAMQSKTR